MRKLLNGLLLLSICVMTALVLINTTEPETLISILGTVNGDYIYLGVGALILYILLETLMIHLMLNHGSVNRYPWIVAFKATVVGQYFNLVTPFSSGGQPMQLHAMVQDGIPIKKGTAVLVNKFLIFQIGVTVYSFILILIQFLFLHKGLPLTSRWVYLGVAINCAGLIAMVLSIYRPALLKTFSAVVIHAMHRLKIIKRGLYWIHWMNHKIDDYTTHIREMMAMRQLVTPVVLLTTLQLTAYFSIGWFVYMALGLTGSSFLSIITLQALLFVSVAFIPTPGSAGASEGGFYLLFSAIFTQNTIGGGIILWRGISYYLNLSLTGLITLGFTFKQMLHEHRR